MLESPCWGKSGNPPFLRGNGTAGGSQVELQQKEGHPTVVHVFDRAVEDVQGRSTVGGSDRASGVMGDFSLQGKSVENLHGHGSILGWCFSENGI